MLLGRVGILSKPLAQIQNHGSGIGFLGNGDGSLCRVIFGVDLGTIKRKGAVSDEVMRNNGSLVGSLKLTVERRGGGLIRKRFVYLFLVVIFELRGDGRQLAPDRCMEYSLSNSVRGTYHWHLLSPLMH